MLRIVHISDTHGSRGHTHVLIPECDILIHSGDIGGRTSPRELAEFLHWFNRQPARCKIFISGNHDICMDPKWIQKDFDIPYLKLIAKQEYEDAMKMLEAYPEIVYLKDSGYEFEGIKFWGSPYSPSFHREYWAFNADRGKEISKVWAKIPSDTNILITHGPVFGILDMVDQSGRTAWHIDGHVGDEDLLAVIKKRLHSLKLHCSGHIHGNTAVQYVKISNSRHLMFSNGAVLDNDYKQIFTNPIIINLNI